MASAPPLICSECRCVLLPWEAGRCDGVCEKCDEAAAFAQGMTRDMDLKALEDELEEAMFEVDRLQGEIRDLHIKRARVVAE